MERWWKITTTFQPRENLEALISPDVIVKIADKRSHFTIIAQ